MEETRLQPVVKNGAREIFLKKFQEIQKRELSRVQKRKEEELIMKRQRSLDRYLESARTLARRWFGWDYNDFNGTMLKKEELVILDKELLKKTRKHLLAVIGGAVVLGPTLLIADIAAATSLISLMSYALSPGPFSFVLYFLGVIGFMALAAGNIFAGVKLVKYFKGALDHGINFLYHRKFALLELREQEKEQKNGG